MPPDPHMSESPFDGDSEHLGPLCHLSQTQGVFMREDAISLRPALDLSVLNEASSMGLFPNALDWAVDEILSSQPERPGADDHV